ncbi:MAG: alpha/beta hydrolase [Pirellulaceae bacterium]
MKTILIMSCTLLVIAQAAHAESWPTLDKYVDHCTLIVLCETELKNDQPLFKVVETWKGKYDLKDFNELLRERAPHANYLPAGLGGRKPLAKQKIVFFFTGDPKKRLYDGPSTSFPVREGKLIYAETGDGLEFPKEYTLKQFKAEIEKFIAAQATPTTTSVSQPGAETQDDKAEKFPSPPAGYDTRRDEISRGKVETVEYDSTTVGVKRKARIYTPPGYTTDQKYPVLYLLHGIGGDENEWGRGGVPDVILDNLYADKKAVPMIVVMPNGRASKDVTARDPIPKQSPAFATFENDLLTDLIPFIEKTYSVKADRESRALAGLSMGGGQSLNFGLGNLDTFAWVGGFSSAPNTKRPADLIKDHAEAAKKLRLLYVACGDKDGLFRISEGVHKMLDEKKVPHLYNVIPGGRHDFKVWKSDLYHFSQLLFR